jgi:putative spermidine/putrescine transport system permease protein
MRTNYLRLIIPTGLLYMLIVFIPTGVIAYRSLQTNDVVAQGGLANYLYFFQSPYYMQSIFMTLRISLITTVISVVLGYGTSLILRYASKSLGNIAILALAFPILTGPIVTTMGWMIMFTSTGMVGQMIALIKTVLSLPDLKTNILGSDLAVIIGLVHFTLAFVILNIINVMLKIDFRLEEAAMNLGANRWQVFRRIILPLSLPGIFSASLLAFALCMSAFVNPEFLGNPARPMMTNLSAGFMLMFYNWPMASVTSVILIAISIIIMVVYNSLYTTKSA